MKKKLTMPHSFVIIFLIILLASLLTYLVPAGAYERVFNESIGRTLIDPTSYKTIEQSPVSVFAVFRSVYDGMVAAGSIVFFVFFAYGYVYMIIQSGAMNGAIRILLNRLKGREQLAIPIILSLFSFISASAGLSNELFGVVPVIVGVAIALGYDAIVGMAMICLGFGIGYGGAFMNPFTIGVAHSIAELPMFSGAWFRIIELVVFTAIGIWWTMRYAKKVKANKDHSYVKGIDFGSLNLDRSEIEGAEFTTRHKIIIAGFILSFVAILFGAINYGWYLSEICGIFFIMMIVTGFIQKWGPSKISKLFIEASSEVIFGALIVGVSRGVLVVLDAGMITDTLIYYLSRPLSSLPLYISAWFMTIIQTLFNFLIPSGSGQAMVTIPLIAPLSDIIGLNRQIAILAFQFGDGLSNLLWPTASIAVMCGMTNVPINKWWRFFIPLFGILLLVQFVFIAIAILINFT